MSELRRSLSLSPPPLFLDRLWSTLLPYAPLPSPDPHPLPPWSDQGCCLVRLVPISQTDPSHATYSSTWWWRQQAPLKRQETSTRLHGATHKTAMYILAALRTWNLTFFIQHELIYQLIQSVHLPPGHSV
jgi:hypothetical protein